MTKTATCILALMLAAQTGNRTVWAEGRAHKEHAELAKALSGANVSLGAGLSASASEGKPISAKFEVEDGKLQLSVYTEKGEGFSEVIIDHQSGTVAKSEAITESKDLAAAKAQSAAMAKGKVSLTEALANAIAANSGFRAVSIVPAIKDGRPIAKITLVEGERWKTVIQKLD